MQFVLHTFEVLSFHSSDLARGFVRELTLANSPLSAVSFVLVPVTGLEKSETEDEKTTKSLTPGRWIGYIDSEGNICW